MTTRIQSGALVQLRYTLYDENGEQLGEGDQTLSYRAGGDEILPALETGLVGAVCGEHRSVVLDVERAYGQRRPELVFAAPAANLPSQSPPEVGQVFLGGGQEQFRLTVLEVRDDGSVLLDGNHPLAGRGLRYEVEITAIE